MICDGFADIVPDFDITGLPFNKVLGTILGTILGTMLGIFDGEVEGTFDFIMVAASLGKELCVGSADGSPECIVVGLPLGRFSDGVEDGRFVFFTVAPSLDNEVGNKLEFSAGLKLRKALV